MDERPDWDTYFLNIASVVASRSTCFRKKCGALIVLGKTILSTGYNGAHRWLKNCSEVGWCYRNENNIPSGTNLEMCRASGSHAESNAICLAARNGTKVDGATMYLVGHEFICDVCKGAISNSGIARVVMKNTSGEVVEMFPERDWTAHSIDEIAPEDGASLFGQKVKKLRFHDDGHGL